MPYVWKISVLYMLVKPDKPPLQTTIYRPISLLSATFRMGHWKTSSKTCNLKTIVPLVSTSQVPGNPSQQTITFLSLPDHHGKLQHGGTCNNGLS